MIAICNKWSTKAQRGGRKVTYHASLIQLNDNVLFPGGKGAFAVCLKETQF